MGRKKEKRTKALTRSSDSSAGDGESRTDRGGKEKLPACKTTEEQKKKKTKGLGAKLLQLFACGATRNGDVVPAEKESVYTQPLTVAQIREHIDCKRLLSASKGLIVLERKVYSKTYSKSEEETTKDQKELELCYEHLEHEVFSVISESIVNYNPELLKQAVEAMIEQENENRKHLSKTGLPMVNSSRPREWKRVWLDTVKCSVEERMIKTEECLSEKMSVIAQCLLHLGKTFREDLTHVVTNVGQHYPKEYDVCNTYARFYFKSFSSHLSTFTDFELGDQDIYLILSWVESIYPNDILSSFSLRKDVNVDELRNLLPLQQVRELEYYYIINEETLAREWMQKSLEVEVKKWREEKEPEMLNDCFHSELPIDILQTIYSMKEQTDKISGDLSRLLMQRLRLLLSSFLLKSYKECFEEFKEKHKQHKYFKSVIIMNINSCQTFRENFEKLNQYTRNDILTSLSEMEDAGFEVLLQDLFQDLRLYFRQFSQKNGLCCYKTMQEIIKITKNYLPQLKMLKATCYQNLVERIHLHLVKEYIIRLMKKKVSQKNPDQQQSMANQILKNALLIEDCCSSHGSKATWLNPVIPSLAEIIKLQDTSAIQIEVASLARKYPDISKKHVAAILYIKGNLTNAEVRAIQDILDDCEKPTGSLPPPLFAYVH
ncbi:tumor necrosis factor alpha-induced protein 2 [Rhinatrema bivittatum]|uniref:tumor necrosis factor alpha-induced protein 2 n=1 Tax=Rhinatrema bivittatum TaxID=194408 RepID=UPI0011292AC6|nr:tumor necrosis factor alpha-induced protein 2 [Rhinatrema bivittatum]